MSGHDELQQALPERAIEAPVPGSSAPGGVPAFPLVAAVGNRALSRAIAGGAGRQAMIASGGRLVVARAPGAVTPAPLTIAMERELSDNDKKRLQTSVMPRLRGAATQLTSPKKADLPGIARHLKPLEAMLNGFAADGEAGATLATVADDVRAVALAVESKAGGMKPAIFRAISRWQAAQRQLGSARGALQAELTRVSRSVKPGEGDPEGFDREQVIQDMSHLKALQAQTGNAVRDLVEAPRNEEGLFTVLETNAPLVDEIDAMGSLATGAANNAVEAARLAVRDGIASLMPFAVPESDFLRQMRQALQSAANALAGLVGDDAEEVEPDPDPDGKPAVDPTPPFDPAPSPNPLPPPPPPPIPPPGP